MNNLQTNQKKFQLEMSSLGTKLFSSPTVWIAYLLVILLFIIGHLVSPGFSSFSNIMNVLNISALLGFIALAQTLVVLSGDEGIDLSVGATASLGAVMGTQIINGFDKQIIVAVLAVLVTGFLIGCINGGGIAYFKVPPLVMTLAMASVIQGMALVYTNGQPKGMASPALKALGVGNTFGVPNLILLWIFIMIIMGIFLKQTKWGMILYGLGTNRLTTELSGVNTKVFQMMIYGASGAIAAFSGLLLISYTGTSYLDIGTTYMLPSIIAVVIGGVSLAGGLGSYNGSVAGVILLTTLSSILITLNIDEGGRQIVYGVVLLILLIIYGRNK
ncbi:ABC transporter permease [Bacillus sp. JJ1521]|uniref:ABC transporter permease n=1 Tax=Bacillus sp. JJ1521 TaxID=3122957 RepID=UPI0030008ECD